MKFIPPLSGRILGQIVEAFDLRNLPDAEAITSLLQKRTAWNYLQGERVKDENAHETIRAIAAAIVQAGLIPPLTHAGEHVDSSELLTRVFLEHAHQWDAVVGDLAAYAPDVKRPQLAAMPYLRLAVIDLALRLSALEWLSGEQPPERLKPRWAQGNGRSALLDELMKRCPERLTRDRLAELFDEADGRSGFAWNNIDRWLHRSEASRPTDEHLGLLAEIFGRRIPGETPANVLRALRLHYGLSHLAGALAQFLGRHAVEGLATALVLYTVWTRAFLQRSGLSVETMAAAQLKSLEFGTGFNSNWFVLKHLWRNEVLPIWRSDLAEAQGGIVNWKGRIEHCLRNLPDVEAAVESHRKTYPTDREEDVVDGALLLAWSNKEDLQPEAREDLREQAGQSPELATADLYEGGLQAVSVGDFAHAAAFFRAASLKDPAKTCIRFNLSAALTELGRFQEALDEAHTAAQIDPGLDLPAAQIGIILMKLGRPMEAVAELETRAKTLREETTLFAYHLGLALYMTRQFGRALEAFERTLRIDANHPDALDLGAACFWELGNKLKAREYAKKARHHGRSETYDRLFSDRAQQ